jgi:spermidine synthase
MTSDDASNGSRSADRPDSTVPQFWFNEYNSPWDLYGHGVRRVLHHRVTEYQEMLIVESGSYGKSLVLDGKWQSSEGDEFMYHEPLVHLAMLQHGAPRRVLVLGGGEGAALREVLRWRTVQRAVMVDIDDQVVEACREHLPQLHQGAFDDPRSEVVIGDALAYLRDKSAERWDVIICDLTDPVEDGPSFKFFTKETFELVRAAMADDGAFVIQGGSAGPIDYQMHARLVSTLKAVFSHASSYSAYPPTFATPWGFVLASDRPIDERPDPQQVDDHLTRHTRGGLRMLDGRALLGMLQPPKFLREAIAAETHVYTLEQPPRAFGKGLGKE